jgi:hypothetical protein
MDRADASRMEVMRAEGDLKGVADTLGTSEDELQYLFADIHKKAERLAERYPELREPPP